MAKVIVLGSNGQLGSDLMQVLGPFHQVTGLTQQDIDATVANVSVELASYTNVDYIINCMAVTNVDGCEDNPDLAFQVNSAFVVKLAKFCQANTITLIHISTDYVLDGIAPQPLTETEVANPLNVYGLTKYAAEVGVRNNCCHYFILRVASLFGLAGAAGKGGNFINTMLKLAQDKDSWQVIDDQYSCPTHTLDVAKAINQLINLQITDYGLYNCVSSSSCSWFEFAQTILRLSGLDESKVKPISYHDYSFKATRPQYAILDGSKLSKFYRMPTYQEALQEYLNLRR